jgi:endonuclease G
MTPKRVLLVLLGATEFPRRLDLSSPTFAKSHAALRDWLLDEAHGPMVVAEDCLCLFDSVLSWPDQETTLADWLTERTATEPAPTDLIVHYVGHGGFRDESRDYYLAIRATRAENAFYSSIMVDSLWRTLRSGARRLRRFLIIDACFAAAAARALMAPLEEAVKVKVRDLQEAEGAQAARETAALPDRGTAVLCSSSAHDPASMAGTGGVTQFTDGLMQVLAAGSVTTEGRLSLAQVHALVKASLSAQYRETAVVPELHAPDQRLGLPQDVPIFPNLAPRAPARVPAPPRGRDARDIPLQMALGNPSGAAAEATNLLIRRPQYALSWNGGQGRANWVSWHLSETDFGNVPRSNAWRSDSEAPVIENLLYKKQRAEQHTTGAGPAPGAPITRGEYVRTGYDCGHLCPPGDRRGSAEDQASVFLMSNVVPQSPVRNRDLWKGLEDHCRDLARQGWELFIIAGPSGTDGMIGFGRIAVPAQLWKIVLALPPGTEIAEAATKARVYAIRMANGPQKRIVDWRDARVTIGSLEEDLGFTFFDALGPAAGPLKRRIEPD